MESFDYVVVGGGTAGCVVAARLSQDPEARVLLLEAGQAEPAAEMSDPLAWPRLAGSAVDWADETVLQAGTGAVHGWPRGRVLGGSSGINGMMHLRGDPSSYDAWAAAGAAGWDFAGLLPYFRRSERADGRDPRYRGISGPMRVAPGPAGDPLWEACFEAAVQAGHPRTEDGNGAVAEGTSWNDMNVVGGRRQSAADAYLGPALSRPNLAIVARARATRLIIEGGACRGVEYSTGPVSHEARAAREVILTAGAIGTPQLLLLSGIGPGQHLRDVGLPVLADLPGVGASLQDHPKSQVSFTTSRPVRGGRYARKPRVLFRSDPAGPPDLQAIFAEFPLRPRWSPGPQDGFSVIVSLMRPRSRGSVRLAGPDPARRPLIDPGYLADPDDARALIAGLRAGRDIAMAGALAGFGPQSLCPAGALSEADWDAYLRETLTSYFHPGGTCRIGSDDLAVVDSGLRVHGIGGLRVADASVMPSLPSANTNATVLAIAERAASIITGEEPSAGPG